MTPSWYDLLGVEPTASADEVRAAWKNAIADLDPTDRRFRLLNQAAEVLLDPARRASYDAELAETEQADAQPDRADGTESDPAPVAPPGPVLVTADQPVSLDKAPDADASTRPTAPTRTGWVVPAWLLVLVALLAAGLVVLAALLWREPADDAVTDAERSALAAAERAVPPVLSYDAADMEGSRSAAASYLTDSYRAERDKLFDQVIDANAPNTGTKVDTTVAESSIVRATDDDRVEVFLLIDQATTNKKGALPVVRTWVTMSMEKVDGDWLVAGMRVV